MPSKPADAMTRQIPTSCTAIHFCDPSNPPAPLARSQQLFQPLLEMMYNDVHAKIYEIDIHLPI
jgi:hypothetical protein